MLFGSIFKMWRTRFRTFISNFILFGLGVMTCLVVLQLSSSSSSSNFIESPSIVVYKNHYKSEFQVPLPQKRISDNKLQLGTSPFQYEDIEKETTVTLAPSSTSPQKIETESENFGKAGPTVFVVTPTFYRPEQRPELTRLAQALLPNSDFIHWIIIDDVTQGSDESFKILERFLQRFSIKKTLLRSQKATVTTKIVGKPRGVGGRRSAIEWLRNNAQNGIVYFADDDNTYDSDIFRQMQRTKKVSMWPVGLVTDLGVSSPIVRNGRIVGFYDGWNGLRKFPGDMAGFAINMQLFLKKKQANMPWVAGYEEDELLKTLDIKIHDIEPLANNCTEILVWHTKAIKNGWPKRPKNLKPSVALNTNLQQLFSSLPQKALAGPGGQNKSEGFSILQFIFGSSL